MGPPGGWEEFPSPGKGVQRTPPALLELRAHVP